jgi:uncharacterized SAM-binding protein YcdF (DUF218 family)
VRRLAAVLLAASLVSLAGLLGLFVLRGDDPAGSADAVVVLGGARSRLPVALDLMHRGVAPTLVVSELRDPADDPARARLCAQGTEAFELLCRLASPYSTRGEARTVAVLARERGWSRVVVVTSRFHLFRTGLLFRRCLDAELALRGSSTPLWQLPHAIAAELAKLGLAGVVRRGC